MIFISLAIVGCSEEGVLSRFTSVSNTISGGAPGPPPVPPQSDAPAERSKSPAEGEDKAATAGRKIIYNAHLDLVTEDLNKFEASLSKLIATSKAYVADSDRTGSAGASRRGSWKIRVPVDQYNPFVDGAKTLGEMVSIRADSQDVSEEFFDIEAREVAKKVEEKRLLKHLEDSTGKLEEILAVERELSRVRSEIERMQGRLRALGNLTSLATVTIAASEIKDYVPPQAPTLGTKLTRTFTNSLETLQQFGEAVLILVVALVPWLPLIAIGLGIIVWLVKKGALTLTRTPRIDPVPPQSLR
jgi:hypothetical protein